MSLYDKPSTGHVTPKVAISFINGTKFQKISLLLLGYLVLINLINIVPTLGGLFTKDALEYPSSIVTNVTSIGLIGIIAAYALGRIPSKWPLYIVAVFSIFRVAANISAKAVTTTFTDVENFTYLEYLNIFMWLGELDGIPLRILFDLGFKVSDLPIESQRLVWIANSIVPLSICSMMIYFSRKSNTRIAA